MKTKKSPRVKTKPTFKEEKIHWNNKIKYVAGVDEVGRGAFAGPLVAASVIFPVNFKPDFEINDSKLISKKKRPQIAEKIRQSSICYSISCISTTYINKHGITKANQQAFNKAIEKLKPKPGHILTDAFLIKKIKDISQTSIIHGDRLSISIAAASIIAKVHRDKLMTRLHKKLPQYYFQNNKGYGTKYHRNAIKKYGLTKHHRTIFKIAKYRN